MKKYLLGILAIVMAVGFSAFTSNQSKSANLNELNWFEIAGSYESEDAVSPSDASFIRKSVNPPSLGCNQSAYQCVSGFSDSQVSGTQLDGNQQPIEVAELKN